jgi:uncharacterized BrkB/YihY/UPF0761 family membrane protein
VWSGELRRRACGGRGRRPAGRGRRTGRGLTRTPQSGPDGRTSRTAALAERLNELNRRSEQLPGGRLLRETLRNERELGGALLAGGVAFRLFLWLTPLGLVVAALLSLWSETDPDGLESAAKKVGIGAAAAHAATRALEYDDRSIALTLAVGLVLLTWFTLGALRALTLSYALAWRLEPPRIRRRGRSILVFNALFLLGIASFFGVAWLHERLGVSEIAGIAASLALVTGVALLAMWLLPHRATQARDLLPGAFAVAAGHQLVQIVVLLYFAPKLGDSEETAGVFGAAATMLVWLYVLSRLITGAAFLNATLHARRDGEGAPRAPSPDAA